MSEFADVSETYDWTEHSTDDIAFFLSLAENTARPSLELGAGTGRLAIPLAESGKKVFGIDISETMLAHARKKWEAKGNADNLVLSQGDFRALSFDEEFDLILAPARVLEHASSEQERNDVFTGCAEYLGPAGVFALYVWGPPLEETSTPPARSRFIGPTAEHGLLRLSEQEEVDFARQMRTHHSKVEELDGKKRTWNHAPLTLRWYTRQELDGLGGQAGLKVEGRYRNFRRDPYEEWSLHMIWVYRKS